MSPLVPRIPIVPALVANLTLLGSVRPIIPVINRTAPFNNLNEATDFSGKSGEKR